MAQRLFWKRVSLLEELWSLLTYEYEVMVLIEENGIFREEKKE